MKYHHYQRSTVEARQLTKIKLAKPFSTLFPHSEAEIERIAENIRQYGFFAEEPLVLYYDSRGNLVLVDGNNRYWGAKRAGCQYVPAVIITFPRGREDEAALEYAIERQTMRRQNDNAVILHTLVQANLAESGGRVQPGQTTRKTLAEILRVSVSTIARVKAEYFVKLTQHQLDQIRSDKISVYDIIGDLDATKASSKAGSATHKTIDRTKTLFRSLNLKKHREAQLVEESTEKGMSVPDLATKIIDRHLSSKKLGQPDSSIHLKKESARKNPAKGNRNSPKDQRRPGKGEHPNNRWPDHHLKLLKSLNDKDSDAMQKDIALTFMESIKEEEGVCRYKFKGVAAQLLRLRSGELDHRLRRL